MSLCLASGHKTLSGVLDMSSRHLRHVLEMSCLVSFAAAEKKERHKTYAAKFLNEKEDKQQQV